MKIFLFIKKFKYPHSVEVLIKKSGYFLNSSSKSLQISFGFLLISFTRAKQFKQKSQNSSFGGLESKNSILSSFILYNLNTISCMLLTILFI
jgi:hypothetical protein